MQKIILGSQSPSRRRVMELTGVPFSIMPAGINEKAIRSDDYLELPRLIAEAKAAALISRITLLDDVELQNGLLITADQVVVCEQELREKPESEAEARRYLRSYDTRPAQTNSAVVVTNLATGAQAQDLEVARVHFNPIPDEAIDRAIRRRDIMASAGAFLIEDPDIAPHIREFEGAPDSVMGLPIRLTQDLMAQVADTPPNLHITW